MSNVSLRKRLVSNVRRSRSPERPRPIKLSDTVRTHSSAAVSKKKKSIDNDLDAVDSS